MSYFCFIKLNEAEIMEHSIKETELLLAPSESYQEEESSGVFKTLISRMAPTLEELLILCPTQ